VNGLEARKKSLWGKDDVVLTPLLKSHEGEDPVVRLRFGKSGTIELPPPTRSQFRLIDIFHVRDEPVARELYLKADASSVAGVRHKEVDARVARREPNLQLWERVLDVAPDEVLPGVNCEQRLHCTSCWQAT
jgi:hypothetical protein